MSRAPLPAKGCFTSSYPDKTWRQVPCTTAPSHPMLPRHGPVPETVGNGNAVSLQVPPGALIQWAVGSFDSVTGVTSESGPINNMGPPVPNAYTIQLNANPLTSKTACTGSPNTMCQGWEQWIFSSDGTQAIVFIQYWLLNFNAPCPGGWNTFTFPPPAPPSSIFCWYNSRQASNVPFEPITNLVNLGLGGTVSANGDTYSFWDLTSATGEIFAGTGENAVNAAASWNTAEFIVAGDGGGGNATFNSGSKIVSRVTVGDGSAVAPSCVPIGFTAETNNLNFGPTAPVVPFPTDPALLFMESSAGGAASNCAAASTAGAAPPAVPSRHDQCVQACGQGEQQCMSRTHTSADRQGCVSDHNVCVRQC